MAPDINEENEIMNRFETVNTQIVTVNNALLGDVVLSPDEKRAILRERALIFAREVDSADTAEEVLTIIEFRLANETYGIASAFVREVYPLKDFTPLPDTPAFILGIINVRGSILSVVDMKKFFNLPDKGLGELNKVIIIHDSNMEFGILADSIIGTFSIPLKDIQPSPNTVSGIGVDYLRGVTDNCVIILDAEKILGDEKIIIDN